MYPAKLAFAIVIVIVVSTSSCTSVLKSPFITYADKEAPLSETAVFSVYDDSRNPVIEARVINLDDKKNPAVYWVRVKPGTHKFQFRYLVSAQWNMAQSSVKQAYFEITVEDMKPKHVYVARLKVIDNKAVI